MSKLTRTGFDAAVDAVLATHTPDPSQSHGYAANLRRDFTAALIESLGPRRRFDIESTLEPHTKTVTLTIAAGKFRRVEALRYGVTPRPVADPADTPE